MAGSGRGGAWRDLDCSAGVTIAAAATAPVLAAVFWVREGVVPVGSITMPVLPPFVSASSSSGSQYRTLILRPDGASLDYAVVRQSDPTLGEPELSAYGPAEQELSDQISALGSPDGADAGDPGLVLGEFGIKWVLLPGPVDTALAQRLDASAGLTPLSKAPAYDLWQVAGPVARVRVIAPNGAVATLPSQSVGMSAVAAPPSGGTLVLAEPDGGWTATLNGKALKPLTAPVDGWAQGFVLPAGGGKVAIVRNNTARDLSLIGELLALLAVCVLALPGKRADAAAEAQALAAVRAAQRGGRAAGARATRGAGLAARAGSPFFGGTRRPAGGLDWRDAPGSLGGRRRDSAWRARRGAAPQAGADQDVMAGVGVGGVAADTDQHVQTGQWDQGGQWDDGQRDGPDQWDDGDGWDGGGPWQKPARLTGPQPAVPEGTGPQGTGPQGTGPQQLAPWESGPQQAAAWETDSRPPSRNTGPHPAWNTGPQAPQGTGPQPAWDPGPQESWDSDPQPSWETGARRWRPGAADPGAQSGRRVRGAACSRSATRIGRAGAAKAPATGAGRVTVLARTVSRDAARWPAWPGALGARRRLRGRMAHTARRLPADG